MVSRITEGFNALFENLPKSEKILHLLILIWVLAQIISSSFMHVHPDTSWNSINTISQFHMYSGLILLPITLIFMAVVIRRRKLSDIYPWLYKNIDVIREDIKTLLTFQLPKARPGGLAATIEGLGLLALLLALVTGCLWYAAASTGDMSALLLEIHKTSVGLIETYFYAHGLFGLLHLVKWWRSR